tara:strand:+ start:988 stop:1869 length:882 start_codon:yes stop_codon:yes gene_type:complete
VTSKGNEKGFHLAGVIPVSGIKLKFDTVTHPSLIMVGENYLALERSVAECAFSGCESIWICADDDIQPIIKKQIGDYVLDPVWIHRDFAKKDPRFYPKDEQKTIPIYYVPLDCNERERLDSYAWGVVSAARMATHVCSKISRWLNPDKFYVSFPTGIYPVSFLRKHRAVISSEKNFSLSYQGETFLDGLHLGFTFDTKDLKNIISDVRKKTTKSYEMLAEDDLRLLPKSDRWSAKKFDINEVFSSTKKAQNTVEIKQYCELSEWSDYVDLLAEGKQTIPERIFPRKKLHKIFT